MAQMSTARDLRKAAARTNGGVGVAFFGLTVVVAIVATFVGASHMPWLGDIVYTPNGRGGGAILVILVVAGMVGLATYRIGRTIQRRVLRRAAATATPAARWARANDWRYAFSSHSLDDGVWGPDLSSADTPDVLPLGTPIDANDVIGGTWRGHAAWAFEIDRPVGRQAVDPLEAVLMQRGQPSPGVMWAARSRAVVARLKGEPASVGEWWVSTNRDDDSAGVVADTVAGALAAASRTELPVEAVAIVNRCYSVLLVTWTPDPDRVLGPSLDLLAGLADALTADAVGPDHP